MPATLFPDKDTTEFQEDYATYLASRAKKGNHFAVFREHTRVMSFCEASLIGHLMNVSKSNADRNGFLMATSSFLSNVGLTHDEQRDLIASLVHKRFIDVQIRDGRRYCRVRTDRIEKSIRKRGNQ